LIIKVIVQNVNEEP